jgi:hypothetical protein
VAYGRRNDFVQRLVAHHADLPEACAFGAAHGEAEPPPRANGADCTLYAEPWEEQGRLYQWANTYSGASRPRKYCGSCSEFSAVARALTRSMTYSPNSLVDI